MNNFVYVLYIFLAFKIILSNFVSERLDKYCEKCCYDLIICVNLLYLH